MVQEITSSLTALAKERLDNVEVVRGIPVYLSPSQLSTYVKCGLQWVFRYIYGFKIPPGGAMIRGRSLDESANVYYRQVATNGEKLSIEQFVTLAVDAHTREVGEVNGDIDMDVDDSQSIIIRAAKSYHTNIASKMNPRSVDDIQKRVEMTTAEGVPILGVIDLVTKGSKQDGIIDTKLKKRFPSQVDVDSSFQLQTYSLMENIMMTGLGVVKPNGEAKIFISERTVVDHRQIELSFFNMWDAINKGVAMRAIPGTWYCSKKWCGYWDICPFGSRGRGDQVGYTPNVMEMPRLTQITVAPVIEELVEDVIEEE